MIEHMGKTLKVMRQARGLTVDQMAYFTGWKASTIKSNEKRAYCTSRHFLDCCKVLGFKVEVCMNLEDERFNEFVLINTIYKLPEFNEEIGNAIKSAVRKSKKSKVMKGYYAKRKKGVKYDDQIDVVKHG